MRTEIQPCARPPAPRGRFVLLCFLSILHKMRPRQPQLPLIQQLRPGGRCR